MAKVWIRAKTIVCAEKNGKEQAFHPGQWLQVGKHQAKLLVERGQAEILDPVTKHEVLVLSDCGAMLYGPRVEAGRAALLAACGGLETVAGQAIPDTLAYPKTLVWDTAVGLRAELFPAGIGLLERWEVAAPVPDYATLAAHVGSDADRARTLELIHDLRVPVYESGALFIRRCAATADLLAAWQEEAAPAPSGDRRLAFIRALYRVKPLVLALPSIWIG